MNLKFNLPEEYRNVIKNVLNPEDILYCVPCDIDTEGKYQNGWLVAGSKEILRLERKQITGRYSIESSCKFTAEINTGSGILIGEFGGRLSIISRYTMNHSVRYAYIARALNQLINGAPKIESAEEEHLCRKCGKAVPGGRHYCAGCMDTSTIFRRLWQYTEGVRWIFPLIFGIFVIISVGSILGPYIHRKLIDDYLLKGIADTGGFVKYIGLMLLLLISNMLFMILRGRTTVRVSNSIVANIRQEVYQKIQKLSLGFVNEKKPGHLMNIITGDTNNISNFIVNFSTEGINQILTLVIVLAVLFSYNWKMALLVLIPAPVVFFGVRILWDYIRRIFMKQRNQWDKTNNLLQDILNGIRVVKAFGKEEVAVERFRRESGKFKDLAIYNERMWNTLVPSAYFITYFGVFMVMYFGGERIIEGRMQIGELVQFIQYAALIYGPLEFLSFFPRAVADTAISLERIYNIMDTQEDIDENEDTVDININGNISYNDVTFGYKSHEPVLGNMDVDIKKGEMIGLVGPSGAGKSTFINLLMRLYQSDEGVISIDGTDIKKISYKCLKKQMGVVLQETFLFAGSIFENIAYAKPEASLQEIIRASKIANAHEFIMNFPDGYDTMVGEKGQRLSGGERQRIAIARAILNDPRILILDEATSSLDTDTEQKIQDALGRLIKDRTTIAIAHRLSTLKNADRLMVIDSGRKVEIGSHEELMKLQGVYYSMVTAQQKIRTVNPYMPVPHTYYSAYQRGNFVIFIVTH